MRLGNNCHYCGCALNDNNPQRAKTQDHKQPLSRGGNNDPANLVPCCAVCNKTKAKMNF